MKPTDYSSFLSPDSENRFLAGIGTATDITALARVHTSDELLRVLNHLKLAIERGKFDPYVERVRAEILQGADVLSAYEFASFDLLESETIPGA